MDGRIGYYPAGGEPVAKSDKRRKGRRARGTGSVFFHEGRRRWVARKVVGGVPVERWGATQREAVDKLAAALPPDPDTITVSEWAGRWRLTWTGRPSTRQSYGSNLDLHILPVLGALRLAAVTTADVERLIAHLLASLGAGTTRLVIQHARLMFEAAVRAGLIPFNPAARAKKPRHEPGPVDVYSPEQLGKVIAVAGRFAAGGVVATLAGTGCRVGEVLALDVADWVRSKGLLTITKTYSLRFGTGPTKSRHSRRTISVPDVLFDVIDAAKGGRAEGPLFPTGRGNRRPAQTVAKCWKSVLRAAGLPHKKLHSLRHSVATALIGAGVPIPDVARYVGDTVATLVRCYVHPTGADPAHTLNRLYGVRKVGNPAGSDASITPATPAAG